jgi:hypothetical protein
VNSVAPRVAERLHLFRLSRYLAYVAVFYVPARRAPLEVAVELYAVRGIDVYALNLATQSLALSQARHHVKAVAQYHPVAPVLVVGVKFGLVGAFGNAVEVAEQLQLARLGVVFVLLSLTSQVVYQYFRMDFFLNIKRRGGHHEVARLQIVLSPPD